MTEIADGGRRVLQLEREGEQDRGAQAWWLEDTFLGRCLVSGQQAARGVPGDLR